MKIIDLIPEKELKEVVLSEYERRLVLYKLIDERFKKRYGMKGYMELIKKAVCTTNTHLKIPSFTFHRKVSK